MAFNGCVNLVLLQFHGSPQKSKAKQISFMETFTLDLPFHFATERKMKIKFEIKVIEHLTF